MKKYSIPQMEILYLENDVDVVTISGDETDIIAPTAF